MSSGAPDLSSTFPEMSGGSSTCGSGVSSSITVDGGRRPPAPTTVGSIVAAPPGVTVARSSSVIERFGNAEEPKFPAGKSGGVHDGVQPARNSVTRPETAPAADGGRGRRLPPVKTKIPSEVRSSASG